MYKKISLGALILILLFGLGIQFIPYGRNHSNPPVIAEPNWDSPRTRELFFRACADCHSNETVWPWYSNIAPVSWLIQRDVEEGRAKFNISAWNVSGENEGDDAAETVQKGTMPPAMYALFRPSARLSTQEKNEFIKGLAATFGGENEGEHQREGREENDDD
jgi:hypothetical protein